MIPLWAISGLAAAAVAFGAGYKLRDVAADAQVSRIRAEFANERAKAAELHAQAMRSEIEAHNRTRNELDANHANAEATRAVTEKAVQAADAAASAAGRSERRLRDALATDRLAAGAAIAAAGAAKLCAPATQTLDLRDDLLGRYRETAGRLGDAGRAIGAFADRETAAARECSGWADAVIRGSASP